MCTLNAKTIDTGCAGKGDLPVPPDEVIDRFARRLVSGWSASLARAFRLGLLAILFVLCLVPGLAHAQAVSCTTANADGSYNVPSTWALTPSGFAVGTKFRLLFVTSGQRSGGFKDIGIYNTYVQTHAKAGHSAISDSCGDLFKVVGSVNAEVNFRKSAEVIFPTFGVLVTSHFRRLI